MGSPSVRGSNQWFEPWQIGDSDCKQIRRDAQIFSSRRYRLVSFWAWGTMGATRPPEAPADLENRDDPPKRALTKLRHGSVHW
jgi:hypothetical protein